MSKKNLSAKMPKRVSLAKHELPTVQNSLLEAQKKSFQEFVDSEFEAIIKEISPITDYANSSWELHLDSIEWGKSERTFRECRLLGLTYSVPVHINVKLVNKRSGEIKKQRLFLADVPIMGDRASFMINGNERVVVLQIVRSEGLLLLKSKASKPTKTLYSAKLMPARGKWFDFEVNKYGVMSVKLLDKHPKILLTTLLRAVGYSSTDQIKEMLESSDNGEQSYLEATLRKDKTTNTEEALLEIYRKIRPDDSLTLENARNFLNAMFFNDQRFYLGKVGRFKLNKRIGKSTENITEEDYLLKPDDLVGVVKLLMKVNSGEIQPDDVDSLMNRRIRGVSEIIGERVRIGVKRMEKNVKDRMSYFSTEEDILPANLVNSRTIIAAFNGFFGSSSLSRYLDQQNILSELEAKRRVTAGGPKGLTSERATFSVRDVHNSHYSRICPIYTPEGPNVGMTLHLAVYSRLNDFGFLEAPYLKVVNSFNLKEDKLKDFRGRKLSQDVVVGDKIVAKKGSNLDEAIIKKLNTAKVESVKILPFITDEVVYLDTQDELEHKIASSNLQSDDDGNILDEYTYVRDGNSFSRVSVSEIDLIDVNPAQISSLALSLIPFSSLDDTNRSIIAAKAQTQAVPLLNAQSPIVGTGFEEIAAKATGRTIYAEGSGEVTYVDADSLKVKYTPKTGKAYEKEYFISKFVRTNHSTSFSQNAVVEVGEKVKEGDILIDGPATEMGEIALGVNLRCAYMHWEGFNYEDAIVLSERLIKDDILTSVHIQEYTQEIRETKLGFEEITQDIPNVENYSLRNLDESGLVRVGAFVKPGDILVGIIAPKGETELSAEEKLLRAIFGDYARDVRDNSLRLPHGEEGVVVRVQVLDRADGAVLNPGVLKQVRVWVARTHKITIGDKLTDFHGGKGVVAKILKEEDMPFDEDGNRVDIIYGPAAMVRRMNVGQLMEAHVGELASKLGVKVKVPPFTPYTLDPVLEMANKEGIEFKEKFDLYDGRTGKKFDQPITVGTRYIFKLEHMADHKVHARSTGPYTMVTQQPLGGRANRGGQRFGEMEVWALEAHATPTLLHEMLTIKSDDVVGRTAAYKSIISGRNVTSPNIPASFKVFDRELAALGIKLERIGEEPDQLLNNSSLEEIVDAIGTTPEENEENNSTENQD